MKITASNIISWVENNNKLAQQELPRIIRRLCYSASSTKAISFPAGDSTFMPSWDGILDSSEQTAWIPMGKSVWEIGTDKSITSKANSDFLKRIGDTSNSFQSEHTYIFITPRRWKNKQKWINKAKSKGSWKDVIAYDVSDLEEWLETQPSVALEVAELMEIAGFGIQSTQRFYQNWSEQCRPPISMDAFCTGRTEIFTKIESHITDAISNNTESVINVYSDSIEESAVSVVVAICSYSAITNAVIVSSIEGWQFVEKNPEINLVICASLEVAKHAISREKLVVIVPQLIGNEVQSTSLVVERTTHSDFAKALELIGEEKSDADRLAQQTGRSWTVYRRVKAINSAIKHPPWLDDSNLSLHLLCLLGSWNSSNPNDKNLVAEIADTAYEEIESSLLQLKSVDDSPVVKIGNVWKVKSPIETLYLVGKYLTDELVDRFFTQLERVFSIPDPALELDVKDRWASAIYDKSFPFSSVLIDGMTNSLVKLTVRGDITNIDFSSRINQLVHTLLSTEDKAQWLTLESYFRSFAEASPEEFLQALETDLLKETSCIEYLFSESSTDYVSVSGQVYFTNLLWALEILAWNPTYLARVCSILVKLQGNKVPSNYGSNPYNSLFYSLFRPWFPQTNATVEQRIQLLNKLLQKHEQLVFDICLSQVNKKKDMAIPNSQPRWRDDNAGHIVYESDRYKAVSYAFNKCFELARLNISRTLAIIDIYDCQHPDAWTNVQNTLNVLQSSGVSDADCIQFQDKFRQIKHDVTVYDWYVPENKEDFISKLEQYIELFKPTSLIQESLWLFDSHYLRHLRTERKQNHQEIEIESNRIRIDALSGIYIEKGVDGLFELFSLVKEKILCAYLIIESKTVTIDGCKQYMIQNQQYLKADVLLAFILSDRRIAVDNFKSFFADGKIKNIISSEEYLKILTGLPFNQNTWNEVANHSQDIIHHYWENTNVYHLSWLEKDEEVDIAITQLMQAKRPVALIDFIGCYYKSLSPYQLLSILELLITEPETQISSSYKVGEIIDYLESQDDIDETKLLKVEYNLFALFEYEGTHRLKTLYRILMNEPDFFMQLILCVYGEKPKELSESEKTNAVHAYKILKGCQFLPAVNKLNEIDEQRFSQYITEIREKSKLAGVIEACDSVLGQILSNSPAQDDEKSILNCVADILDLPDAKDIRNGFDTGIMNQGEVTSREIYDGGIQERELADKYNKLAQPWAITHPFVAQMFRDIAKSYERKAKCYDTYAQLNKECLR